jgi:hypothetical protein
MEKYKDRFVFKYEKDSEGKVYNKLDNFISCRSKGKIYRVNSDILVFESQKRIRIKNENKETNEVFWDYTDLILEVRDSECEREIFFKEENLEKLEGLFKIKRRKQMSEEAREKARARMLELRIKMGLSNDVEITDEELEDGEDENEDEVVTEE